MKKLNLFIVALVCILFLSVKSVAQTPPADYFVGKWNVLVVGTPQGDATNTVVLERKDGKLTGQIILKGGETKTFTRIVEKDKNVTAYFQASGYDVYLFLEKKDDNSAVGSMMDMFDATAERVVETESK